jgi:hypothetical protein
MSFPVAFPQLNYFWVWLKTWVYMSFPVAFPRFNYFWVWLKTWVYELRVAFPQFIYFWVWLNTWVYELSCSIPILGKELEVLLSVVWTGEGTHYWQVTFNMININLGHSLDVFLSIILSQNKALVYWVGCIYSSFFCYPTSPKQKPI